MLLQSMLPLDNEFHYISLYSLSKVLKRKWIMLLMYITFLCLLIWIVLLQQILILVIKHLEYILHLYSPNSNQINSECYFIFICFLYCSELESKLCISFLCHFFLYNKSSKHMKSSIHSQLHFFIIIILSLFFIGF